MGGKGNVARETGLLKDVIDYLQGDKRIAKGRLDMGSGQNNIGKNM